MFIGQSLPFVTWYVDELDSALRGIDPEAGMSRLRKKWLSFCIIFRGGLTFLLRFRFIQTQVGGLRC